MRVRNITGLEVPDGARPGDTLMFTGTLTLTVSGVRAQLIDVTPLYGPPQVVPGDTYAEFVGHWMPSLLPQEETA